MAASMQAVIGSIWEFPYTDAACDAIKESLQKVIRATLTAKDNCSGK